MTLASLPLISELVVDMSCSRPPSLLGVCWRPTVAGTGFNLNAGNQRDLLVKIVSVNYAIRFNDLVTALTAPLVRYGVGPDFIYQPSPSLSIKTHSSPAAFPTTLSLPFFPWALSPSCTLRSCFRLLPSSTYSLPAPRSPQNRSVRKM